MRNSLSFLLFLSLVILSCKSKRFERSLPQDLIFPLETDKCYYALRQAQSDSTIRYEAFDIEIQAAVFVNKDLSYDEIINTDYFIKKDSVEHVLLKEKYTLYTFNYTCDEIALLKYHPKDYFKFQTFEIPGKFERIDPDIDLKSHKFRIQVVQTPASIKRVFWIDNPNQKAKNCARFNAGFWSKIKTTKIRDTSRKHRPDYLKKVEKKLQDLGYPVSVDGRLDQEDKNALMKFQKDNNLSIGALDFDTLKKLDLVKRKK